MDAFIKLSVDNVGRILKEVIVSGVLPSALAHPDEPLLEPGEINIDIYGDDTAVTNFFISLAHKINKGTVVFRELAKDADAAK